jgi:hypothetical protein
MQKDLIRNLKNHYGPRWRCNESDVYSQAILSMLLPGNTLILECDRSYPQRLNLSTSKSGPYHNVLALNPMQFKYQTLNQLSKNLLDLQQQTSKSGRIFASFNFQFVNFNRLQQDFSQALEIWINDLSQHNLVLVKNFTKKLPSTNYWGDCFFIFENNEIPTTNLLHQTHRSN